MLTIRVSAKAIRPVCGLGYAYDAMSVVPTVRVSLQRQSGRFGPPAQRQESPSPHARSPLRCGALGLSSSRALPGNPRSDSASAFSSLPICCVASV